MELKAVRVFSAAARLVVAEAEVVDQAVRMVAVETVEADTRALAAKGAVSEAGKGSPEVVVEAAGFAVQVRREAVRREMAEAQLAKVMWGWAMEGRMVVRRVAAWGVRPGRPQ